MISEAWSKRRYPKSFVSKLIEADGETSETTVWLDFSKDHNYLDIHKYKYFTEKYDEVSRMLYSMITQPEKFCY